MSERCIIVGAGLAGLAAAHTLRQRGIDVLVLEADQVAGGKMRTQRHDGWLLEWGPQTFLAAEGSAFERCIDWAGLQDEVVHPAPSARKRFVLSKGRLWQVPLQLHRLLPLRGVLRLLSEPLARRGPSPDESVDAFARRRFGPAAAEVLFDAFVSGVHAGDAKRLEARSAFPRMVRLEDRFGSVVLGGLRGGLVRRKTGSFRRGMGSLPEALAEGLGDQLRLNVGVQRIAEGEGGWIVHTADQALPARTVLITTPAYAAARLLHGLDPALADLLDDIVYAPLAVVVLGYDQRAFSPRPPEGFGFLAPRRAGLRTLGCLYPSTMFPDAAPPGKVQLRAMIGGRLDPGAVDLDDASLVASVRAEVGPLVGAGGHPELIHVVRHPQAIPQYELGHAARLKAIDARLSRHPGLFLAGNPYRGVSVSDVAQDAESTALCAEVVLRRAQSG